MISKIKNLYLLWFQCYQALPKTHRYSLGQRIDAMFVEIIEATVTASFLPREKKLPFVQLALRKVDTIKVLLMVLWETKSLDDKKYITLSLPLQEIGKMLGGWNGQLLKQNSPAIKTGEK
ncbi:MAG: four helix bundle protein [Candidatus Sungiibacteriota bacterium]